MQTTASSWHKSPKARAILARLSADDISLDVCTPSSGPRFYRWCAGAKQETLYAARQSAIEAEFGCTFAQANEQGRAQDYLALHAATPSISEVLADRFGDPSQFGPCPQSALHGSRDSNPARAAAHVAAVLGRKAAA